MRTHLTRPSTLLLSCCITLSSLSSAEDFPGIQQLMGNEKFEESGLKKLNTQELNTLNKWLVSYTAHDANIIRKENSEVKKEANAAIYSSIVGTFSGWNGKTKFTLENGQVWKQRNQSSSWRVKLENPKVRIDKNFLGFYELTILEKDKSSKVERIK